MTEKGKWVRWIRKRSAEVSLFSDKFSDEK